MATGEASSSDTVQSLYRSMVTQYWPFTVYVMAYVTVGMALGASAGGWNWSVWGIALATIWFGLEGLHALDLSEPDIATDIDPEYQTAFGATGLIIGSLLGLVLALLTSIWFLAFVVIGTATGVAYNLEVLDGTLHDHDRFPGVLNFGFAWGFVPAAGGFFLAAGTLTPGAVLVSFGVMVDAMALITVFETSKPDVYDDLGIAHRRRQAYTLRDVTASNVRVNKMSLVSWVLLAAGVWLLVA
jgi:hypothetical protein